MYRKAVFSLVAVVSLSAPLSAAAHSTLRGEVTSESPVRFQDLSIELQSPAGIPERTVLSMDGKFEFREVEMGQYRLRVVTLHGDSIREEYINVSSGYETLTIRLRGNESSTPSQGVVSARRLSHKPNKQAVKEYREATKAAGKGDRSNARAHLERSVAIDPEYFEAQYSLGGERIMAGDPNGAMEAYDKALEIDPSSAPALVSRGIVLLHLHKTEEAEETARKALQLGAEDNVPAHYVLGLSMAARGKNLAEALEHLKISAPRFAHARQAAVLVEQHLAKQSFR
jgi:Flp pilus assembly protein TadD